MKIFKIDWKGKFYVKAEDGEDAYRILLKHLNIGTTKEVNPFNLDYNCKAIEIDIIEEG